MSDRILILREGQVVDELDRKIASKSKQRVLEYMIGRERIK